MVNFVYQIVCVKQGSALSDYICNASKVKAGSCCLNFANK